jgi:high-affinity nickel permease
VTGSAAILAFGFFLGMRHATDADHVVAVSTIVAKTKRLGGAWLLGAVWGLGHSVTVFGVGALIVLGKLSIPRSAASRLEAVVGLVLIGLGLWSLFGRERDLITAHSHGDEPAHLHLPEAGWLGRALRQAGRWQLLRSATVGLVHGLAGSAAAALLVLAAIPQPRAALLYLLLFGAGTLCGMLALSAAMEYFLVRLAALWTPGRRGLVSATGGLSVAMGLWIVLRHAALMGPLLAQW